MRTIQLNIMLCTLLLMAVACTTEDPFSDYSSNGINWNDGGSMPNGGTSTTEGSLATFDIATEQDAEEPTTTAQAYYPDDEDQLANNSFGTTVTIDMSNPVAKTENGVEVTVSGGHVTVNHGTQKGICYVVSGTTTNGSLTVLGEKKYQVVLNGVNIYNPDSAARTACLRRERRRCHSYGVERPTRRKRVDDGFPDRHDGGPWCVDGRGNDNDAVGRTDAGWHQGVALCRGLRLYIGMG